MLHALLKFSGVPEIGFAHHFYTEHFYQQRYNGDKSIEIAYIKEGTTIVQLYDHTFVAEPGSLLVLFRHIPFSIYTNEESAQAHASIQMKMEYDMTFKKDGEAAPDDFNGLIIPFVVPPCAQVEAIKKELYSIITDITISRKTYQLSASLAAMGILYKLDKMYRKNLDVATDKTSLLSYRTKRIIASTLHTTINISDLAEEMGKTPNYLNAVFKKANGISIRQYINEEKVRLIANLIENVRMPFSEACESVGITDISYGYRLFKKQMGITPKNYLSGERYLK